MPIKNSAAVKQLISLGSIWLGILGLPVDVPAQGQRIGVLTPGLSFDPALHGLREGLERVGLRQDKDFSLTIQDTKGTIADLITPTKKLLGAGPNILFAVSTTHAIAAKQAAGDLPIVFSWVSDPLKSGLITGYGHSKSNVTGVLSYSVALSGKRLEILKELAPKIKRVLAVVSAKEGVSLESAQLVAASAAKLGLEIVRHDVSTKDEIEKTLAALPHGAIDAIYHVPSVLVGAHVELLIKKSKEEKLPLMAHEAVIAERGALFTFGADLHQTGFQAARLVAKIFKGIRPAEIPVETPDQLVLVVNQATMKLMGAKISREALSRADRIIQ